MENQSVAPSLPSQVFYAAPAAIARLLCTLFLLVMLAMYAAMFVLMPVAEAKTLLLPLLPLVGVGMLGEIAIAFFLSWRSPVRISDAGITVTEFWGHKRTLSWDQIESAALGRCLSLPFLKISSFQTGRADRGVTTLTLPLVVTRPEELRDAIHRFTTPIHPIQRVLEGGTAVHPHALN